MAYQCVYKLSIRPILSKFNSRRGYVRYTLVLSYHKRLGFPRDVFCWNFDQFFHSFLISSIRATCPFIAFVVLTKWDVEYKLQFFFMSEHTSSSTIWWEDPRYISFSKSDTRLSVKEITICWKTHIFQPAKVSSTCKWPENYKRKSFGTFSSSQWFSCSVPSLKYK